MQFEKRSGNPEQDLGPLVEEHVPDPKGDLRTQRVHEDAHEPLHRN